MSTCKKETFVWDVIVKALGQEPGEACRQWFIAYDDQSLNAPDEETAKTKAVHKALQRVRASEKTWKPRQVESLLLRTWMYRMGYRVGHDLSGQPYEDLIGKSIKVSVTKRG